MFVGTLRPVQRHQAGLAAAGVVVDNDQTAGAMRDQPVDPLPGLASAAEPDGHHGRAVADAGQGLGDCRDSFVDHEGDLANPARQIAAECEE